MPKSGKQATQELTRDREIRAALLPVLYAKYVHSDADLALEEFSCNRARADIAIMNGVMHAFEIKSDSDSLQRLPDQIHAYEGVFDLITVVVGRRLIQAVEEDLPRHCGIILATLYKGKVKLTHKRKARRNPNQRNADLARLLWKTEALSLLKLNEYRNVNSRTSVNKVWAAVANTLTTAALALAVRQAVKLRRAHGAVEKSELGDDSLTTESTALLDHYSANLAHLLAVGFQHHPD